MCNDTGETANVSESSLNALLSKKCSLVGFHRYRRALRQNAHVSWDQKTTKQWEDDRKFFNKEYRSLRDITFEGAEKHAHEQLFLRCCD